MKNWLCAALICTLSACYCSTPDRARSVLEQEGYRGIETGGISVFGCSEDDRFRTKFTAISTAGGEVSGVVCCGWLKSCTVRVNPR